VVLVLCYPLKNYILILPSGGSLPPFWEPTDTDNKVTISLKPSTTAFEGKSVSGQNADLPKFGGRFLKRCGIPTSEIT